jgi:hypothetical protein
MELLANGIQTILFSKIKSNQIVKINKNLINLDLIRRTPLTRFEQREQLGAR